MPGKSGSETSSSASALGDRECAGRCPSRRRRATGAAAGGSGGRSRCRARPGTLRSALGVRRAHADRGARPARLPCRHGQRRGRRRRPRAPPCSAPRPRAALVPPVEQRQLAQQHRRLQRVQPGRVADPLRDVALRARRAGAAPARSRRAPGRRSTSAPASPERTQVLGRIEAEGGRGGRAAGAAAVARGAVGLARVLDQIAGRRRRAMLARSVACRPSARIDARAGSHGCAARSAAATCSDRSCSRIPSTSATTGVAPAWVTASNVAMKVWAGTITSSAAPDAGGDQCESQRVEPARGADALAGPAIAANVALEALDVRAVRELTVATIAATSASTRAAPGVHVPKIHKRHSGQDRSYHDARYPRSLCVAQRSGLNDTAIRMP